MKIIKKKLFEFSLDANKEELLIRKIDALCNGFVAMALLQMLRSSGFYFFRSPMFTSKAIILLHDGL